jgi:hypothetical protein
MDWFIQLHNMDFNALPMGEPPLSDDKDYFITTGRPEVQKASGKVFLILAIGKPRRYFLWRVSELAEVNSLKEGGFSAGGPGWELAPPAELKGPDFDEFKKACASFVCFRRVTDLPYTKTLRKLADKRQPPGSKTDIITFLRDLYTQVAHDVKDRNTVRAYLEHYGEPVRALSIQQPHAEAILRGIKKIEYRSIPTKIRGRVYIYASKTRFGAENEKDCLDDYRIRGIHSDDLPRGSVVGTVEVYGCREDGDGGYEWLLRKPERAKTLLAPENQPQPVWFNPW